MPPCAALVMMMPSVEGRFANSGMMEDWRECARVLALLRLLCEARERQLQECNTRHNQQVGDVINQRARGACVRGAQR